ncbi:hypothetical protein DXG03_008193 [Asterophora parasitica]|uniref:Beta-hexosaminidase n=1 Tax=Asterophora parasitica TaxID=117018 RepID=A0A9P7G7W4_9AGAR|nr:hypothetical protein DXG03_008193 [Asterophora parasitica]
MRLLTLSLCVGAVVALWPIPRNIDTGTTLLKLAPSFDITLVDIDTPPQDLLDAIARTKSYLATDNLQRLVPDRGADDAPRLLNAPSLPSLQLSLSGPVRPIKDEAILPLGTRQERYSLTVPADGTHALLTAQSTLGLFRGLTTFSQLWYQSEATTYAWQTPVNIVDDEPAFPYRGFMLDTARNFFPVPDIKRTLDAMSWVKLNTFHWHVVDSQSFPLHVPAFPDLASNGAYSPAEIYSPSDVQDIVDYAGVSPWQRGIDVLLEIDTPGHTAVLATTHPEHIACLDASPWSDYANEPPAGQLRIASPDTTNFTATLIKEIAAMVPRNSYFSTGGDEVNVNCYLRDAETSEELAKRGVGIEEVLGEFVQSVHEVLREGGKTPVVWEEMVLAHANVGLGKDTLVMVWISSQHAAAVAAKGFRIVHAPSDYFYLDCGAGEWLGNNHKGNSWCDPFKTWQKAYTFDPYAGLGEAQRELVLGGQQLLWTEQADPANLDSIVWPRAASAAEVFWTGHTLPDGTPRAQGVGKALPRLHDLRYRMAGEV